MIQKRFRGTMLKEVNWSEDRSYRTGSESEPIQFYMEGLSNSKRFDLLLGYFSSAAINVLSLGFASFLYNGGTVRMVVNNILSQADKDAIKAGREGDVQNILIDLSDIKQLKRTLDEYGKHFFDCLAWLIANDKIQIKIIRPKSGRGIAHYKSGAFYDGNDTVSFKASCNFTAFGLLENLEELDANLSWEGISSLKKVARQNKDFEEIFSGKSDIVEYLDADEITVAIKKEFGKSSLNELLIKENELAERKSRVLENKGVRRSFENAIIQIEEISRQPKFPYKDGPRRYQKMAFENWKNNNQQGLFAMATGTGKTITSLNCLLEIYKKTGYYKALILVPTITLVNQWENECRKFNFTSVVKICSRTNWKNDFSAILTRERLLPTEQVSYIVIATYASFARVNIFTELNQLSAKTLLIADECHNMGSSRLLSLLPKVTCKRRIGLSATPERQFDEDGTKKIYSFFNSEGGYTYEFSMKLAIEGDEEKQIDPVLCRYYYYPHLVSLTEKELRDYIELSVKISKFYKSDSDSFSNNPILTALMLSRKRIIHKAVNKVAVFNDILREQYGKKGNLEYTLVYAPEGNDPNDYFETDYYLENDQPENDNDAERLIDVFTKTVRDIGDRITVKQFISETSNKDNILEQFANGEIDVLTSMKCLDEGVDVPRAELAIFCASTGNPRQFVQRRGRILRRHPQKPFAYIHDLVVIPEINSSTESYNMERSLIKKELERVNNFALLSENSSHTINALSDTMNYYNLNLYNNE